MKFILSALTLLLALSVYSQNIKEEAISRKKVIIPKVTSGPKIDGILDEEIWQNAVVSENFIERSPNNGKPEEAPLRTIVKMVYDDTGIYFGATMHDPLPANIQKEYSERDDLGNDDVFAITINGYNDQQQAALFLVQASGVQADAKIGASANDDFTWNAVWFSAVKISETGWTAEIKIPFSELRFPKKDVQEWGLNFMRIIQKTNQNLSWNFVDNKKGTYLMYDGILTGIENINPPLRLSFTPYIATYHNSFNGYNTTSISGGMDVKYGINDAFTLDLTLIPDFGQTSFDNSVLNLGPFEQQFQEQRSFFTEGTELFNKGNLFYSRRVGGNPSLYPETLTDEVLTNYPNKVKLFNAFKISGRNNKGLGIGFFNGITEKMEATVRNGLTGQSRQIVVEPWANYNVLVLDQRFNKNSSVSLVNTNVMREGDFRDANTTGFLWDINNKMNTYNLYGNLKGSWVREENTKFGSSGEIGFGKTSGKNRFGLSGNFITENWDINDLGFSTSTNFATYRSYYNYRLLQPTEKFNNINVNWSVLYTHRLQPFLNTNFLVNNNTSFTTKKYHSVGGGIQFTPFGEIDIDEPRSAGRYLKIPGYFNSWIWTESDSRKKLQYNLSVDYYAYDEKGRNLVASSLYLRYRFSDRMSLSWNLSPSFSNNETGFAGKNAAKIYIGRRQRNTYENGLTSKYTFNDKMSLSLAFRHYYSDVTYKTFYTLTQEGTLNETSNFKGNLNTTYNSWNVDLRYSWWFAPGSQLTLMYRNAAQDYLSFSRMKFKDNFSTLFDQPMVNNFSLKLTYYVDYNQAKNFLKNKL